MKKISVFVQLVLILFIVSVVPIFFLNWHNSKIIRENAKEVVAQQSVDKLHSGSKFCDTFLSSTIDFSLDIVMAKEYAPFRDIKSYQELNSSFEYVSAAMRVNQRMQSYCNRNKTIHSAFYYMEGSDFVISTDRGICRLKEYEDISWIKEASRKIQGAEGVWHLRTSEKDNYLSYVYRISSLYTANKGIVVINIPEKNVNRMISEFESTSQGAGILINSRGDVLSSSNSALLYQNIADEPYVSRILGSGEHRGWDLYGSGKDEILYTYEYSELYDWIYINTYDMETMFADTDAALRREWPLIAAMVLLVSIVAVFVAFIISKPIRNLAEEVRRTEEADSGEREVGKFNELTYLSQAVGKIKVQEKVLKEQLQSRETVARSAVFEKLLYGEALTDSGKELLSQYFTYHHFIVCLLVVDEFAQYRRKTDHDERESCRNHISNFVRQEFSSHFIIGIARYAPSSIAVILNINQYDSSKTKKELAVVAGNVQKYCRDELGITLTAGISTVHNDSDSVKDCTVEAMEAVERRMLLGNGHVIFYQKQDDCRNGAFQGYFYEKRLMNYLEIGDKDSIEKELKVLIDDLKAVKSITNDDIFLIFNQLIGAVMAWIDKNGYRGSVIFGRQHNLFLMLTENENLEQLEAFMKSIYNSIIQYRISIGVNEDVDYCQKALAYISKHYNEDIVFEEMAESIGVSYSYLRKVVKEETGKSLSDHLNLMRIEEAKRLLIHSSETILQIALSVGYHNDQALNRFFKKYEGMAPGEYRDNYR